MLGSTVLLALVPASSLVGDTPEWGGFRGNNGAGVSDSESIPDALALEETALWRVEIPVGYSSPIVVGERVFLTASEGTTLMTMCIERETGDTRWTKEVEFDGARVGMNSSAAPSPVTDGEHVYSLFHAAGLIAYDLDGEEKWRKNLGAFNIPHGMSTSPLLHGDLLILVVDQDLDSYVIALDKKTGEERWKVARPGVTHSYSTPAIYAPEDGPAQVIVSGALQTTGYAVETGEKLWWVNGAAWQTKAVPVMAGDICIINAYMVPGSEFGMPPSMPSWENALAERDADGDGKISRDEWQHQFLNMAWFIFDLDGDELLDQKDYEYLLLSGKATGGLYAVQLDGKGDVTDSHILWKYDDRRGLPDIPSPLVLDDTVYLIKEGGLMTAIDVATGEKVKAGRVADSDQYYASPISAGGKIVTASQSGQLAVVSAGRDWEVISVNRIDEEVWATPAIADGKVIVRSNDALYCFQDLED